MNKQKIICSIIFIASTLAMLYALLFNVVEWLVYLIAIVGIPFFVLSFGLLTMAKPRKGDEEGRVKEPFTGY